MSNLERAFEREILDHARFLQEEEEAARLEMEFEAEYDDWVMNENISLVQLYEKWLESLEFMGHPL